MATTWKPEDIPDELVDVAHAHYSMHGHGLIRNILAGVLTAFEPMLREQIAREIETNTDTSPWETEQSGVNKAWIDSRDCTKAARIARGEPMTTNPTTEENQ